MEALQFGGGAAEQSEMGKTRASVQESPHRGRRELEEALEDEREAGKARASAWQAERTSFEVELKHARERNQLLRSQLDAALSGREPPAPQKEAERVRQHPPPPSPPPSFL